MKKLALVAALAFSASAQAAWIPVVDPDTGDLATNPQYVSPQDPASIEIWLEDLLNTSLNLVGFIDSYNGSPLSGLVPGVIALHYGGGQDVPSTIAYSCDVGCSTFDPPNTFNDHGISNERAFTFTARTVPEPGTLALLGIGVMGLLRRRAV